MIKLRGKSTNAEDANDSGQIPIDDQIKTLR